MATKTKKAVKEEREVNTIGLAELKDIAKNIEEQTKIHRDNALKLAGASEILNEVIKKVQNESI